MSAGSRGPAGTVPARPAPWRMLVDRWTTRLRERTEMAALSARDRRDARLSAYDVECERRKPMWRD